MKTILLLALVFTGFTHAAIPDPPLAFTIKKDPSFNDWPAMIVTANVEFWSAENPLPPLPQPEPAEVVETRVVMSAPRYLSDASAASRYFGPGRLDRLHLAYQRLPLFLG